MHACLRRGVFRPGGTRQPFQAIAAADSRLVGVRDGVVHGLPHQALPVGLLAVHHGVRDLQPVPRADRQSAAGAVSVPNGVIGLRRIHARHHAAGDCVFCS